MPKTETSLAQTVPTIDLHRGRQLDSRDCAPPLTAGGGGGGILETMITSETSSKMMETLELAAYTLQNGVVCCIATIIDRPLILFKISF